MTFWDWFYKQDLLSVTAAAAVIGVFVIMPITTMIVAVIARKK